MEGYVSSKVSKDMPSHGRYVSNNGRMVQPVRGDVLRNGKIGTVYAVERPQLRKEGTVSVGGRLQPWWKWTSSVMESVKGMVL